MFNRRNDSILKEWLNHIQNISPVSIQLNLDRIQEVAFALKLFPFNIYTILIGGTNGKGSTCFLLEKILLKNNIRVGLYTSPHLLCYRERIRVCGKMLPNYIHTQVISIIDKVRNNVILTYFEFITLSALYIFKQFNLDLVILEVGLGGRLDATNIVNPNISVITNIAMDHIDLLGNTRHSIAIEKSGIFRPNGLAIIGENDYPIIIDQIAKDQGVKLFARGRDWDFFSHLRGWNWIDRNNHRIFLKNLPIPKIPLENAATVLSILRFLPFKISKLSIYYGLQKIFILGRFQIINNKPLIVFDVGHNPHAAVYTVSKLLTMISDKGVVRAVIGMLSNKDIDNTILYLNSIVSVWYLSELNTPLSATIQQLSVSILKNNNVKYFNNIINAWKQAISDANINDCILVFGSFYTISPILKFIMFCKNIKYIRN